MKELKPRFVTYRNSRICWYRFGSGAQPVICFHGYGENGSHFSFLERHGGGQFTFIAIDLPFHGKTEWHEGLNFHWQDLRTIIEIILAEVNGKPRPTGSYGRAKTINNKLILLGFSLGARVALFPGNAHRSRHATADRASGVLLWVHRRHPLVAVRRQHHLRSVAARH